MAWPGSVHSISANAPIIRAPTRIKAGAVHPSLSPTDGTGYCQCEKCKAQDDPKATEVLHRLLDGLKRNEKKSKYGFDEKQ